MKTIYTTFLLLLMVFTVRAQTLVSETTEQQDNLIVNKKYFDDGSLLINLRAASPVPTDLTAFLNLECEDFICATISLGCCFGDGWDHPEDTECTFPDYQVYYVTQDTFIEYELTVLRNARLEARFGSSIININNDFVFSTACDNTSEDQITELRFLGVVPGQLFPTLEAYQETLSTKDVKLNINNLPNGETYILYDTSGRQILTGKITSNTKTDLKSFSGLYYLKVLGYNDVLKIVN